MSASSVRSREKLKILSVIGARPQFIKVAPLCHAIQTYNSQRSANATAIEHVIVHTGQHHDREMAELFFVELEIPEPNYNLKVDYAPQHEQIARMMERLEPVLIQQMPDWVMVYGDTNSTLSGALVAARLQIPLVHVEAGCRSFNMRMPEEQNRVVADHLSQLLFVVTESALQNLHREGIGTESDPLRRYAIRVGDLMYDALLAHLQVAEKRVRTVTNYNLLGREYCLLTLHRAENTQSRSTVVNILSALDSIGTPVLFPIHPRTRRLLLETGGVPEFRNIVLSAPLGYLDMLIAEKYARAILTDSGGVQKEAFFLNVPCITLRSETEWPETVATGLNTVVGTSPNAIVNALRKPKERKPSSAQPFGTGDAANLILQAMLSAATPNEVERAMRNDAMFELCKTTDSNYARDANPDI